MQATIVCEEPNGPEYILHNNWQPELQLLLVIWYITFGKARLHRVEAMVRQAHLRGKHLLQDIKHFFFGRGADLTKLFDES